MPEGKRTQARQLRQEVQWLQRPRPPAEITVEEQNQHPQTTSGLKGSHLYPELLLPVQAQISTKAYAVVAPRSQIATLPIAHAFKHGLLPPQQEQRMAKRAKSRARLPHHHSDQRHSIASFNALKGRPRGRTLLFKPAKLPNNELQVQERGPEQLISRRPEQVE